jgi:NitT/TauT family transport system substrate-binding protein
MRTSCANASTARPATDASLETAGVDAKTATFVEVPFQEMSAALARGDVDAAFMVEPYITQSERQAGAIPTVDAASGPTDGIPIAAWATTSKFARENPRTTAAFQRAIQKGQQDTIDRGVVEQVVTTFVKVDPQTAVLMNLGTWPTTLSATRMQRVIDLMKKYGLLTVAPAAETMIFTPSSG